MFSPLPSRFDFPAAEKEVLAFWDEHDIFGQSLKIREGKPRFVFYEGPPTANGMPHPGHALTRAVKDLFPRYKAMCGYLCERKGGWDTHGLPVEREVEKELTAAGEMQEGGKAGIEAYGIERFVLKCINSVWRYTREWEEMTRRLGFWVNLKEAYATYHQSYVESVWWSLKTLFERGLLYEAHKVVWWWAQGGTALSSGEVGEGYRTVDDPSVFVKFPLAGAGVPNVVGSIGVPPVRELEHQEEREPIDLERTPAASFRGVLETPVTSKLDQRRRILPHWEAGGSTYFLTFRLDNGELNPAERSLVIEACLHWHTVRMTAHALVVMPDHVHLLCTPTQKGRGVWWLISDLMHSIKGFAAKEINRLRGTQGEVWQREYFDRIIRSETDFEEKWNYVVTNPDRRRLPTDYPWVWTEDADRGEHSKTGEHRRPAGANPTAGEQEHPGAANPASKPASSPLRGENPSHRRDADAPHRVSLLVWTTTPWTLISNHFAAVHPDLEYALVEDCGPTSEEKSGAGFQPAQGGQDARPTQPEYLYIAAALVEQIAKKAKRELRVVSIVPGHALIGLRYLPPFGECYRDPKTRDVLPRAQGVPAIEAAQLSSYYTVDADLPFGEARVRNLNGEKGVHIGWRVLEANFVTVDSGSGIVHQAPAFGEVDFQVLVEERFHESGQTLDFPLLCAVNPDGTFNADAPERYRGRWVKDCDKDIIRELRDERKTPWGTPLLYHQEQIRHEYPFCPRAPEDPLIQYARKSWFVRTSQFKDEFLKNNAAINWLPEHIKEGRMGDFLRNNVDWALSRERYWGTPLPIWVCEKCGKMEAIASFAELREKPGATDATAEHPQGFWAAKVAEHRAGGEELPDHLRVHKPYIDAWTYECSACAVGSAGVSPAVCNRGTLEQTITRDLSKRRRYKLPHWEAGGSTYFLTFRARSGELAPAERTLVLEACKHWDGQRMRLHSAVVMPDHVHLLCTPLEKHPGEWWSIADLMHSIKSFTSKRINEGRATEGSVWQGEYFDRIIRTVSDFDEKWNYIVTNPERRGLPDDYEWLWVEPGHEPVDPACGRDAHTPPVGGRDARTPRMRRVPEVIDCWWDAGSMPFAQWGFPNAPGSTEQFAQRFPADFISEAIDQTRGWFYGLLAINTLLFGNTAAVPDQSGAGFQPGPTPGPPSPAGGTGFQPVPSAGRGVMPHLTIDRGLTSHRRNLPHWESGGDTYHVTFRLQAGQLAPAERDVVLEACRHWDGVRLRLHAVAVMPDHVHLLCTPMEKAPGEWWSLADLMHSIKRYSAKEINSRRGVQGTLWQEEYFDRAIRSGSDFEEKWNYVVTNPERAGLGEDYAWVWVEAEGHGLETRATRKAPYPIPYRTCIVLGHMFGEDGNKMSKRLRNYREPTYIFDSYGADAMRWYFFSAQAPWTSTRFVEASIRDSHREFLVKLYNVLSFFTIYASIDGFDPREVTLHFVKTAEGFEAAERRVGTARPSSPSDTSAAAAGGTHPTLATPPGQVPMGWRPSGERTELDRWIITELRRTVTQVRESMDRFENFPAAQRLNDFVDALSNWYVRRSRERFWKARVGPAGGPTSPADQEKWDAYHTLYGCLRVFSHLIAPFTPFFAETMHKHLRIFNDPISVHLCDYPKPEDIRFHDETLAATMDTVRELVALGRSARTSAKLKVRQPLALVEIVLAKPAQADAIRDHAALIAEELNVQRVELTSEADHYVSYKVVPNFKAIGGKFRALVPGIKAALAAVKDPAAARRTIEESGRLALSVDGQTVELTPEDVEIRLEAKPGWSAAQGRSGVVILNTEVTPELRDEGLVREFIHHVQAQRKELNLAYQARVTLHVDGPAEVLDVLQRFIDEIKSECLATAVEFAAPPGGGVEVDVEGQKVQLALTPN